ncbi:hypothetical protein [Streptomyces tendae]|uniref:hypothetical protein n=1 Tax=Streptomyces tendae TaxID=1932 RepID=UPI003EC06C93
MGSEFFTTYQAGTDAKAAFEAAVEDARYEYGHRSYTGTIAEKDAYTVIDTTPIPLYEAERKAGELADAADPRIDNKRGPAGALPVLTGERTVDLDISAADAPQGGFEDLEEAASQILTARGLLRTGEKVAYGVTGSYRRHPRTGRLVSGVLRVPLKGGPLEHTGWLFFGWASC